MVEKHRTFRVVQRKAKVHVVIDFAALTSAPLAELEPMGQLFVIRCEPDPFTGERINVGVCVVDRTGQRYIKVITEPGRLDCLYGDAGSAVVLNLAHIAGACALQGIASPSSQIIFDAPTPFYNATPKAMLESTFADQVTVAIPRRTESGKKQIDDEAALRLVTDNIKRIQGLEADFLANTPQVLLNTERGPRSVTVPLQPKNGVGTIRSADYSTQALKTHLMDSLLDLECAARYRNKGHLGIFILRPQNAPEKIARATDVIIDSVAFRAPKNLHLEVEFDGQELAQRVSEWAAKAA